VKNNQNQNKAEEKNRREWPPPEQETENPNKADERWKAKLTLQCYKRERKRRQHSVMIIGAEKENRAGIKNESVT
jgi:hypothetical protein